VRNSEVKKFKGWGDCSHSFNRQPHQQGYLKKTKKTHQSVGKYNSNFQKETTKTKKLGIFSNLPFFFSSFVLAKKSFSLISYLCKLLFLTYFQKQGKSLSFFKNPP